MVSVELLKTLHGRIEKSVGGVDDVMKEGDTVLAVYNRLQKHSTDVDMIRKQTYNNSNLKDFNTSLHATDRKIQKMIIELEIQIATMYDEKISQDKLLETTNENDEEEQSQSTTRRTNGDFESGESIETLKSRLLSTKHNQLDQIQTNEIQNNYHESIQQELIESLPSMVSSLKEQASQFQEMLMHDASILKEATQNFEASQGKFDNVNTLLSKYHKEGKLGFWFYIRVTAMIVLVFMILLIIIRLIPARH